MHCLMHYHLQVTSFPTYPVLVQDFENTLDAWMAEFHKLLVYQNPGLAEKPSSDKPSAVDAVKAAVCQNINLLVNRDEEEFSKFLQTFVSDVWGQLINVSTATNQVGALHEVADKGASPIH